ncbi:MAG TPA: UDP-glucose/GDP-mannose dehydrogenase family protein [Candidatus Saccharimonadales bacterium]|nr:UDP-glucose/GDP-mannose dehydrogenase family protein [Candidatus Saccharimonadales bacterium]
MSSVTHRIVVIGAGYVGLITAAGLALLGHRVEVVEVRPDRLAALREGRAPIHEAGLPEALTEVLGDGRLTVSDVPSIDAELAMICVGTPIGSNGRSDLSQLGEALRSLAPIFAAGTPLLVRSTLPPGATLQVVEWTGLPTSHILTNPEFLRQGTALHDFLHPTRVVIGHFPDADPEALALVRSLYAPLDTPILMVDVAAAELIKNGANAFLALKLSFANEIAGLAEEYGTDVDDVLAGIALDPRIGNQYMRPGLGFGGSCLPKELRALAVAGEDRDLPMHVTRATSEANHAQQRRFAARVERALDGLEGRTVGLLGLAFKAGTDDVRDSPALGVARELLARGARVRAYDPAAARNALAELPELEIADTAEACLQDVDAVVVATEWPEFRGLDWVAIRDSVRQPLVIDGRRLLDPIVLRALGFRYLVVGGGDEDRVPATVA